VPVRTAGAQIVGRDPTISATLFNIAPAATALLHIDLLPTTERIDDGISGTRARTHVDVSGGDSGGCSCHCSGCENGQGGQSGRQEFPVMHGTAPIQNLGAGSPLCALNNSPDEPNLNRLLRR